MFQILYKKTPKLLIAKMINTVLKKLEFTLIFFLLSYWHILITRDINYCENRGYFGLLQRTVLSCLRRTQYWSQDNLKKLTEKRLRFLLKKSFKEYPQIMQKYFDDSALEYFYQVKLGDIRDAFFS